MIRARDAPEVQKLQRFAVREGAGQLGGTGVSDYVMAARKERKEGKGKRARSV